MSALVVYLLAAVPQSTDQFDIFVSYARRDNVDAWISSFIEALQAEHRAYSGGRSFTAFFDKRDIRSLDDWRLRIHDSLAASRLFVAFISPAYLSSEWCQREWRAWIDVEIAKHVLSDGAALIYIVQVPWLARAMTERETADAIAQLTGQPAASLKPGFAADTLALSADVSRRQFTEVRSFYTDGLAALRREDLRRTFAELAKDLDERALRVESAAKSKSTIPPYNRRFVGRYEELLSLRERLFMGRAGVISGHRDVSAGVAGVHGLGGIGKTEVAFTYAHAFAGLYPGGRFLVSCEGISDLRLALIQLDGIFANSATDAQRKSLDLHFSTIRESLRLHLGASGRVLLVLDNVSDAKLLSPVQTDVLRVLGPNLHLLATTRLGAPAGHFANEDIHWITLNELSVQDSLRLLEKHRPLGAGDYGPASQIAQRLGGFALCIEVVGAYLNQHPEESYEEFLQKMRLDDLEPVDAVAERNEVVLRRRNNDKRLSAILSVTLVRLTGDERNALDFAALLPPDFVVLPWVALLVSEASMPQTAKTPVGIWAAVEARLFALALLTRNSTGDGDRRIARCHRLVQDYLRAKMADRPSRQAAIRALVQARDALLKQVADWREAKWELVPLARLAEMWDETDEPYGSWLANQVALKLDAVAAWSEAEPLARRALASDQRRWGDDHPRLSGRLNNLARILIATNRNTEAETLLRKALAIDRANPRDELTNLGRTLTNLAGLLSNTNRMAEAGRLLQEAENPASASNTGAPGTYSKVFGFLAALFGTQKRGSDYEEATALNNKALFLMEQNQMAEAEKLLLRSLQLEQSRKGGYHADVARVLLNLGGLCLRTNRLEEAESLLRAALDVYEKTLGLEHPSVATCLDTLAIVLMETNRLSEAEQLLRRALAIAENGLGPQHADVGKRLNSLATVLQRMQRHPEAEPLLRRTLAITEASFGADHPHTGAALNNLSQLLQETGRLDGVEAMLRRALSIQEKSRVKDHPEVATALNNLGAFLMSEKNYAEAEPLLRRALQIDEQALSPDHPDIGRDLSNLASLYMDLNRFAEAEPLQRRLVLILLRFLRATGQRHPTLQVSFQNYWGLLASDLELPESEVLVKASGVCAEAGFNGDKGTQLISALLGRSPEMPMERRLKYVAFLDSILASARAGKQPDFQMLIRTNAALMNFGLVDTMRETAKRLRQQGGKHDLIEAEFLEELAKSLLPVIKNIAEKRSQRKA